MSNDEKLRPCYDCPFNVSEYNIDTCFGCSNHPSYTVNLEGTNIMSKHSEEERADQIKYYEGLIMDKTP